MNQFLRSLISAQSDQGSVRENNEDRILVIEDNSKEHPIETMGILLAVADGMGGHVAGETASRMACEVLEREYYFANEHLVDPNPLDALPQQLVNAFHRANDTVYEYALSNPEYEGMGTTLTAMVLLPEIAWIAHVGDSRVYRLRDGALERLTVDHTEVQALIDMGRLRPEKAATHPRRNLLTQSVGVETELEEVYSRRVTPRESDIYLLCSDGLYDMVPDDTTKQILLDNPVPQRACDALVAAALGAGGKDNVTVIVARM